MKKYKLATLFIGLLIIGCNQRKNIKTIPVIKVTASDSLNNTNKEVDSVEADKLTESEEASIKKLINLFKHNDVDQIANHISFPLQREYPIPSIKNKEEFKLRFNEVFDKILIERIANSKISQWSEVGWRGIMLDNGTVWMANSDGIITTVNYQSAVEKKISDDLIVNEKENLPASLSVFSKPTYRIKTKNYLIRIDEISNEKYRYASWKITDKESNEPELVIAAGDIAFNGSGGNHVITFINGNYTYKVYRNIIRTSETADITLEIEKNGKTILIEDGTLVTD